MELIKAMRVYEIDGEERVKWYIVGEIFEGKNGKEYVILNQNPKEVYYVFEKDEDWNREKYRKNE